MMGTQAAPLPQLPQGAATERNVYSRPDTEVVNTQSVMSMAPLVSSASEQSMSEIGGNSGYGREVAHNRSISEPDFGKTPPQVLVFWYFFSWCCFAKIFQFFLYLYI